MEIIRGKQPGAQKVVIYGPEGIGKSTLASRFPQSLFIDTEGSTRHMDVARLPKPGSWSMLLEQVAYVKQHSDCCRTLVIDTADWAEQLCMEAVCAGKQVKGIEDIGYGKGYVYLAEEFGRLLNRLHELNELGIHTVCTAHAQMRKFEQPDEMGSYDRWELKLQKKTAPLLKEWADLVLFANYKTYVLNVDGQGAEKGKNKATGGKRVMYTTHHPCWDAKNRMGLPEELPMEYGQIASIFEPALAGKAPAAETSAKKPAPPQEPSAPATAAEKPTSQPPVPPAAKETSQPRQNNTVSERKEAAKPTAGDSRPLTQLRELMTEWGVSEQEIREAVAKRGYYTAATPITQYDPAFVAGVLVGAWKQVHAMIVEQRTEEIPF